MNNKLPSNRKFGISMCLIIFVFSGYFFFKNLYWLFYFSFIFAIFFIFITLLNSPFLTQLNSLWFSLGDFLGKFISPFILGGIFFLLITPIAIIGKVFGRDILIIKRSSDAETYWIKSEKRDAKDELFENQF
jgi:hypothetical protein